jgi:hypothetical protein
MALIDYFRDGREPGYDDYFYDDAGSGSRVGPSKPTFPRRPTGPPTGDGAPTGGGAPAGGGSGAPSPVFPTFPINPYGGSGAAPIFTPPPEFDAPEFTMPNPEDDPGYQFRLQQGLKALNANAAQSGTLLTGGTLRDLMEYGQGFASNEYSNVFDRAARAYENRYREAADEYGSRYKTSQDLYQSRYDPWAFQGSQGLSAWQSWIQAQLAKYGLIGGAI